MILHTHFLKKKIFTCNRMHQSCFIGAYLYYLKEQLVHLLHYHTNHSISSPFVEIKKLVDYERLQAFYLYFYLY